MPSGFKLFFQNQLNYKLLPIAFRETFFLHQAPCAIYASQGGLLDIVIKKGDVLNRELLKSLIAKKQTQLFVQIEDRELLRQAQQENLRNVTRSISIGDPLEKTKYLSNLLAINLVYLYEDPTNDEFLNLQVQSAKALAVFLFNKPQLHFPLFKEFLKQGHHYIYAQPFLSSLFLLGIMKHSKLYVEKEIENFFLTSYLKDIGMSAIPVEKYNQEILDVNDKKLFLKHPQISVEILKGRTPLPPQFLKMIENHHMYSTLTQEFNLSNSQDSMNIYGFETMMISVTDTIAAMTTDRPFRKRESLYKALDMIRVLIADQYPEEFKLIVMYFKHY